MGGLIEQLDLVGSGDLVVDAGCGCGAMVPWFAARLGDSGRYIGFDVHRPSIAWCRKRYAADHRLTFELVDVATPFSKRAAGNPSSYTFPVVTGAADFILAKSLFTHLREAEARHYLAEIRRALRPGKKALVTAFLFDASTPTPTFPFPGHDAPVRWRVRVRPHAGIAYSRPLFEAMVHDAGLHIADFLPGFWPGASVRLTGQDVVILS